MKKQMQALLRAMFMFIFIAAQTPALTAFAGSADKALNNSIPAQAGMSGKYALANPGPAPAPNGYTVLPASAQPKNEPARSQPYKGLFGLQAAAPLPAYGFSGGLEIEPITAYNLIVDSNVLAPSSYGPNAATLGAKFCNRSGATMNNIWAYIGDYDVVPANRTPGVYPIITPAQAVINTGNAALGAAVSTDYGGTVFSLKHASGTTNVLTDASRYIGTLNNNQCVTQYWLITYPRKAWNGSSWIDVTGGVKPQDDLWLPYDFWATSGATTSYYNRYVTMRNEISAMANKIWPNGDNKVPQQYLDAIQQVLGWSTWIPGTSGTTAWPGDTITSQGIWYDLGNVGAGFDNNYDLVPDRNAWVQPIGDASSYDPGCFRLVKTYGLVIVKLNTGDELLIPFVDQLYFENIPGNNTGAVGLVFYEYVALDGACTAGLTPYQEVASGFDNEKFNGDFGAGIPPLVSRNSNMLFDKNGPTTIGLGGTINYTLTFYLPDIDNTVGNTQTVTVGNPSNGTALTYYDRVPVGLQYVTGSATANATMTNYTSGTVATTRWYSTNAGLTWSTTDPGNYTSTTTANQLHIKWVLSQGITSPASGPAVSGTVGFSAIVPGGYTGSNIITNNACMKIGDSGPPDDGVVCDPHTTVLTGTSAIQGTVWADDGKPTGTAGDGVINGTEVGIFDGPDLDATGVTVWLYWDGNGDGDYVDVGDFLYATTTTESTATGFNYCFDGTPGNGTCTVGAGGLPATTGAARYIIVVDALDGDIPTGYGPTTTTIYKNISLPASTLYGDDPFPAEPSDFGFAPALTVQKRRDTPSPVAVGGSVQFTLTVNNTLPGNGENSSACVYYIWSNLVYPNGASTPPGGGPSNAQFQNPTAAGGHPDQNYAFSDLTNNTDLIAFSGFNIGNQGGNITKVEVYADVVERKNLAAVDNIYLRTWYNDAEIAAALGTFNGGTYFTGGVGTEYFLTKDITSARAWAWSDFTSNLTEMQVEANKGGGSPGDIDLDAVAFRITTDGICDNTSTTLNPVPLIDEYNPNYLTFVSSSVPLTSGPTVIDANTNRLTWANVGPLYPGQTKTIKLIFTAVAPISPTTNVDESTGAYFSSGRPANSDLKTEPDNRATVVITTNPAPKTLSGKIFDDNNTNGWVTAAWTEPNGTTGYDAGDVGIPGIPVDLYACVDRVTSALITTFGGSNKNCDDIGGQWIFIVSTTTNASGNYSFTNLFNGYYFVDVHQEFISGPQTADVNEAGTCTVCDSLSSIPDRRLDSSDFPGDLVNNASGTTNVNFGYNVGGGSFNIGDTIYYDWNGNGVQNVGVDEGIPNVTVQLVGPDGVTVIATTTTDINGNYLFSGYAPGFYSVRVVTSSLPAGVVQTGDPDGAVMDNKSTFNLTATDLTRDFGYKPSGSGTIGDTVFRDMNGDGIQGGAESGISGVTVKLQVDLNNDGTWVTIATKVTDANGNYLFSDLPAGTFRVVIDRTANAAAIPNDAYGNEYVPSNGTLLGSTVYMTKTLPTNTSSDLTADFGFAPGAAIGDTVYLDANGNGTQDFSEPGINGVTVTLYTFTDSNGNSKYDVGETLTATGLSTVTNASGYYIFSGLTPGYYAVVVTPPAGSTLTGDPSTDGFSCLDLNNPADPGEPSSLVCDHTDGQRLYNGTNYTGADFGYQLPGNFGDSVWIDANNNGAYDVGETGIPNITVTATTANNVTVNGVNYPAGTTLNVSTDANGNYNFTGIVPVGGSATWTVTVNTADPDMPAGLTNTYDPDGTTNSSTTVVMNTAGTVTSVGGCSTLPNGCDSEADPLRLDADFGYRFVGTTSISGTICLETTVDGVCGDNNTDPSGVGAGESAFSGVAVYLYKLNDTNANGLLDPGETTILVASTLTNANGDYSFTGLADGAGTYYVIAIGAPMSGLNMTSTTGTVNGGGDGSQTTQTTETTAPNGDTISALQVVNATAAGSTIVDRDFSFNLNGAYDFGDDPASYAVNLQGVPDGARHLQPVGGFTVYLGAIPDTEPNGQPTADASGDGNDENGVFVPLLAPENTDDADPGNAWEDGVGVLQFDIIGSGWLVGWIDWNRDGDFGDVNEMVISQAVSPGLDQDLNITTPVGVGTVTAGNFYSRFRIFTSQPGVPQFAYSGPAINGEVEDYLIPFDVVPTPVTLSYFKASGNGSVSFEWSTATELGNVGFNIYDSQMNRLNTQLIASKAPDGTDRQDYSFSAVASGSLFYIEDVALGGETRLHGPFTLGEAYGDRSSSEPINWSVARSESANLASRVREPNIVVNASSAGVNFKVNQTGIYRVTFEALRTAGFDLTNVMTRDIKVSNHGQAVPIYVYARGARFGAGAYIEFYGQALDTLYTDTNVYTLQIGSGTLRVSASPSAANRTIAPTASFAETVTVNRQNNYASYGLGSDPWYDTYMMAYNTPESWNYSFDIKNLANASSSASMTLTLWGLTQWPQENDHHILVSVNGNAVADLSSDGFVESVFNIDIPSNTLHEGANTLTLTLPGDRGVSYDVVTLDKFTVTYQRTFQAENGRLAFTASGRTLQVTNLPNRNVVVYRIDNAKGPVRITRLLFQRSGSNYSIMFAGTTTDEQYLVSTVDALYAPTYEAARQPSGLNTPAQYLIIAHPNFISGLQPLIQARQTQGFSVNVVDVNDLYAQYSGGVFDPQAIKDYVAYAEKNLGTQYVLLVGGDTSDYRNYLGYNSISFVPSLYVRTGSYDRFTPSDSLIADTDGDLAPEVAIGRFPVRTTDELAALVQKTLAYASKDYGQTAVVVADKFDGEVSFKSTSISMASDLPGWTVEDIFLDNLSVSAANTQLVAAMNRGTALVTFTGHSGPGQWTFPAVFSTGTASGLTNAGRPFVALQWGCWDNYYVDPRYNYLVQSLLLSGDRGAAATLGAVTRADSRSEEALSQILTPRLVAPGMTIGQALQFSKAQLAAVDPNLLDVLYGYTIMGDPALVIQP